MGRATRWAARVAGMNEEPRERAASRSGLWIALISLAVLIGLVLLISFALASFLPRLAPGL